VSDQFGRRRVLLTGVAAYVVTSALCAASPSIEALIAARFIQGLAGGVGIVIGQAAGRDVFSGTQLIRFYGRLTVVGGLAAVIGPLLGGQLNTFLDWRGLFAFLALVGAILLAVIARQFPETLPYVADLDNAVIDTLLTHAWSMSSPRSYTIIFHLGGALTDVAPGSAVFDGRTGFAVNINGAWSDGEPDDRDWVKQEWTALHPHSRGVYVNFLDAEDADRVAAAYGDAGPALARLKRTYDPDNVFHHNHNIAPEGT
jgi:MFS family permease